MKRFILALPMAFIALAIIMGCGGCDKKDAPSSEPTLYFRVKTEDSIKGVTVTVNFENLQSNNNHRFVVLQNLENLREYKKQIEFMLNRLDEAEKRMLTHEPKEKK